MNWARQFAAGVANSGVVIGIITAIVGYASDEALHMQFGLGMAVINQLLVMEGNRAERFKAQLEREKGR